MLAQIIIILKIMKLSVQSLKGRTALAWVLGGLITIGIYAILFLPAFLHSQFFFPFIVPKNIVFRIIVEIIFGAYVILAMTKKFPRPRLDWLSGSVALLFVVMVVSMFFGENLRSSLFSTYERMSGVIHYLHVFLFFFVLTQFITSKKQIADFLTFTVFVNLVIALLALTQQLNIPVFLASSGGTRLTGTIGNAAFYGGYLVLNIFIVLFFLLSNSKSKLQLNPKVFAWSIILFDIFIVGHEFLMRSRGLDGGLFFAILKSNILIAIAIGLNALAIWYLLKLSRPWRYMSNKIVLWSLLIFQIYILFHTQTRGAIIALLAGLVLLAGFLGHVSDKKKTKQTYYGLGLLLIFIQLIFYLIRDSRLVTESIVLARLGKEIPLVGIYFSVLMLVILLVYSFWRKQKNLAAFFSVIVFVILLATPYTAYKVRNEPWAQASFPVNLIIVPLNSFLTGPGSTTIESRVLTWQASWSGWKDHLLLGYGPENYYIAFNKNFPIPIYQDAGSRIWFDRAHNFVFDWGVSTGILGLAAYASIFVVAFWYLLILYRRDRSNRAFAALMALLVAFLIQNLFVFDTLNTDVVIFLIFASLVPLVHGRPEQRQLNHDVIKVKYGQAALIILVVAVFIYHFNVKPARANHELFKVLRQINQQAITFNDAVDSLEHSINTGLIGKDEARQQLANFVLPQLGNDKIAPDDRLKAMQLVLKELKKTAANNPQNTRYLLWLAQAYNRAARVDPQYAQSAIKVLNQAIEISEKRAGVYYELGQSYLLANQPDQAIEALEFAVQLNPDIRESQMNLGSVLILLDKHDKFDGLLNDVISRDILLLGDYLRFVDMYKNKNDVQRVLRLYQVAVEKFTDNPDVYVSLAQTYKQLSEDTLAKQAFEQALKLKPDLDISLDDL